MKFVLKMMKFIFKNDEFCIINDEGVPGPWPNPKGTPNPFSFGLIDAIGQFSMEES